MKLSWMNRKWMVAVSVVSIGCATVETHPSGRETVDNPPNSSVTLSDQEIPQSDPPATGSSVRLVSSESPPATPAENRSDEKEAGSKFLRPPAVPAPPAAIEINQQLAPRGEPLTLEHLEALACQNNPTLLQAQGQIEGELGKAIQAGLWPNPVVSYVQEQIGVGGTPGEFMGGAIQQRIVTGHKLALSRAKYRVRAQAAEWHALEQQYRVLNDVRVHYFRTRGRHELVQIHRELLKSAEDTVLTARERYNVGQATRAQVHLANVALQRARLDLLRSENDYREAFETLTALVGVELPLSPLATPLEGDMTPIDWQDAASRLIADSPQLQAARSKLESDRITIRRETVQPVPDLIVEGSTGYNHEAGETVASARLAIEVPIFDWNQGTIRQAEADYARQQGEIRRMELLLKQDLARVYRGYVTAMQHATNYAEVILPEARSAYELQLRSYKENRIAWSEVLQTQADMFMLRAEYLRNLIAWRESEVLISGFLLHGGLMAPTAPPPPGHIDSIPKPR
jgi:outer membrane protein TolC